MTEMQITYLVGGVCGLAALVAFAALVVRPAWGSYSTTWERLAASFLTLYVLASLVGLGVAAGLGAVYWLA